MDKKLEPIQKAFPSMGFSDMRFFWGSENVDGVENFRNYGDANHINKAYNEKIRKLYGPFSVYETNSSK